MMRVMVLESDRHAADEDIAALRETGHEVVRCHEDHMPAFPCNGLCDLDTCPLEGGEGIDLVLDHRTHPYPRPTSLEDGVSCAVRRHVPLVVSGASVLNPFESWTTAVKGAGDDIVATCAAAATAPLERLAEPARLEVRRRLAAEPDVAAASDVTVRRTRSRLNVTVSIPDVAPDIDDQLAVAVTGVVRRHDRFTPQIDVVIERCPTAQAVS
jgi:hypothetical protein